MHFGVSLSFRQSHLGLGLGHDFFVLPHVLPEFFCVLLRGILAYNSIVADVDHNFPSHQGRVEEAKATLHTLRGDSYAEEKIMEVLWACLKKRIHLDLEEVIGLYDNSNGS